MITFGFIFHFVFFLEFSKWVLRMTVTADCDCWLWLEQWLCSLSRNDESIKQLLLFSATTLTAASYCYRYCHYYCLLTLPLNVCLQTLWHVFSFFFLKVFFIVLFIVSFIVVAFCFFFFNHKILKKCKVANLKQLPIVFCFVLF